MPAQLKAPASMTTLLGAVGLQGSVPAEAPLKKKGLATVATQGGDPSFAEADQHQAGIALVAAAAVQKPAAGQLPLPRQPHNSKENLKPKSLKPCEECKEPAAARPAEGKAQKAGLRSAARAATADAEPLLAGPNTEAPAPGLKSSKRGAPLAEVDAASVASAAKPEAEQPECPEPEPPSMFCSQPGGSLQAPEGHLLRSEAKPQKKLLTGNEVWAMNKKLGEVVEKIGLLAALGDSPEKGEGVFRRQLRDSQVYPCALAWK